MDGKKETNAVLPQKKKKTVQGNYLELYAKFRSHDGLKLHTSGCETVLDALVLTEKLTSLHRLQSNSLVAGRHSFLRR